MGRSGGRQNKIKAGNAPQTASRGSLINQSEPIDQMISQAKTLARQIKGELNHWQEGSSMGNSPAINTAVYQYGELDKAIKLVQIHLDLFKDMSENPGLNKAAALELQIAQRIAVGMKNHKDQIDLEGSPEPEIDSLIQSLIDHIKNQEEKLNVK